MASKADDGLEAHKGSFWSFGSSNEKKAVGQEDVFNVGDPAEGDIQWKNLNWWQCGMIMIAESISLGILSLPSTMATVGLVPGIMMIIFLGALATYSGYVIGQFRIKYPAVHSMGDAFEILGTRFGKKWGAVSKEVGGIGQLLFMIFLMGSHLLTWGICFDKLTGRATCNIVWGVVGMVLFWLLDIPRTLKGMSYLSIASSLSVLSAVLITIVALVVEKPVHPVVPYTLWPATHPPFYQAVISATNIIFAFSGHAAFFSFISELKDPKEFTKSLALLQIIEVILYLITAVVTYIYAGQNVKSPALSSTSPLMQKVSYGIAIPTIVIAGVIYGHVNSKYLFARIFAGTEHMKKRTLKGTVCWLGITAVMWVIAWIISRSIPHFNNLLGLIASLFGSWFTYGAPGFFWLHMNGLHFSWQKKCQTFLTIVNVILVVISAAIFGIGVYSSSYAMHIMPSGQRWSCGSTN